jgi:hypothetical protein
MSDLKEDILNMVRKELKKNPDANNEDLFAKAIKIDPGLADLSPRQFNARYPLLVKRELAPRKPPTARRKYKKHGPDREQVKNAMLLFTQQALSASPGELLELVASVDNYVDQALNHMVETS